MPKKKIKYTKKAIQELKKQIELLVNAKPSKWSNYPKLIGMNPDECFKGVLNYTIDIGNNNKLIYADTINNFRAIVARGIRSPEQIIEDNKIKEKRREEELKHFAEPKEELGAGDGLHFGQGDF